MRYGDVRDGAEHLYQIYERKANILRMYKEELGNYNLQIGTILYSTVYQSYLYLICLSCVLEHNYTYYYLGFYKSSFIKWLVTCMVFSPIDLG